jgi:hypothetical protein
VNVDGKLEAFPGMVRVPARELPERTPEKLHPCSTPTVVASRLTLELTIFPRIVTVAPQFPVPVTVAEESVRDESASVIEAGEHEAPGSRMHPLQGPATVKAAVMTGAVVVADFEQPASIDETTTTARARATRMIEPLGVRLWAGAGCWSADASRRAEANWNTQEATIGCIASHPSLSDYLEPA